jgi:hypothetical protein
VTENRRTAMSISHENQYMTFLIRETPLQGTIRSSLSHAAGKKGSLPFIHRISLEDLKGECANKSWQGALLGGDMHGTDEPTAQHAVFDRYACELLPYLPRMRLYFMLTPVGVVSVISPFVTA